jgi:hypothetical protein
VWDVSLILALSERLGQPPRYDEREAVCGVISPMSFAALASLLSLAFAVVVSRRWSASGKPAFAAWTIGLLIFAAAAGCQAVGEANGWSPGVFRAFYLLGGVLGVAYLALGTVFLLTPPKVAWWSAGVLGVCTIALGINAFTVPVDSAQLTTASGVLGKAIAGGTLIHAGAVILNIVGSLVLIVGSGWSAWKFVRSHAGIDRVVCNVLLTAGAFTIAAGFSAAKLAGGKLDTLGAYEAVGIAIMFAGFLSLGHVGVKSRRPQHAVPQS